MIILNLISDDYILHVYTSNSVFPQKNLLESKYGNIGQYSYRIDPAHNPNGQKHLHGYLKGNELFALNLDGSAHDGYHQTQIPQKFVDALPKIFKGVKIPENGLIECAQHEKYDSLTEDAEFCEAVALAREIEPMTAKEEYLQWVLEKAAEYLDDDN